MCRCVTLRKHRDGHGRDHVNMEVHLIIPVAMEKELRLPSAKAGRTVGAGVITDIVE